MREEMLDVLLAQAREVGRLGNEVAALEHQVAWGSKTDAANLHGSLRTARNQLKNATAMLAKSRTRFLATLENNS